MALCRFKAVGYWPSANVARPALGTRSRMAIDCALDGLPRDMRRHLQITHHLDKKILVVAFVRAHGAARFGRAFKHLQGCTHFGVSIELGAFHIHDQPVTVFHQSVGHMGQATAIGRTLAGQPRLGIGSRLVSLVAAFLTLEIEIVVARAVFWRLITRLLAIVFFDEDLCEAQASISVPSTLNAHRWRIATTGPAT